jgi:tRNA dimethylallyltransferase
MTTPLLVVVGPTASGKSDLAMKLAEARTSEIVSADSVQVYRLFDIGTGKPTRQERERVRHHMIDVCEPNETLDAAGFARQASEQIQEIQSRNRGPIVCGGTFLWVRALLFGLAEAPAGDDRIRAEHRLLAEREGRAALHRELAKVDAECAARLNPNDFVRVSRALEVFQLSGKPMSEWQKDHGFKQPLYDAKLVGIRHEPAELDRRIRERTVKMLERGWLDEVRELTRLGHRETRAMASVGYKQVARALEAESFDLPTLTDEIVRATRIFARRQRTWLRDQPVTWVSVAQAEGSVEELCEALGLE